MIDQSGYEFRSKDVFSATVFSQSGEWKELFATDEDPSARSLAVFCAWSGGELQMELGYRLKWASHALF